uniref:Homeobox domain-containing protein n=1 Tax=Sinocyclocheilus anshuiensis TaxID=1608454 RepID=A0A671MWE5_9TELE
MRTTDLYIYGLTSNLGFTLCKSIQFAECGSCAPQVKIWFQNRRMKWRNSREKESTYTRPPMERLMLWSQSEPADKTHTPTQTKHTHTHSPVHSTNAETR